MARIRTIKPEFWVSGQVVECSTNARLLFIGMWTFADDQGVHVASPKQLKMEVFPGDDFSTKEIAGYVSELIEHDLIREIVVPEDVDEELQHLIGTHFWVINGWHHQKIDKPNSRYPVLRSVIEHSTNVRRPFALYGGREGKDRSLYCSEPPTAAASEPAVLVYPCSGRIQEWNLTQSQVDEWAALFPGLDVMRECRAALAWCRANTAKRKTASGMPRFLSSWLTRSQNRGSTKNSTPDTEEPEVTYAN